MRTDEQKMCEPSVADGCKQAASLAGSSLHAMITDAT